MENASHSGRPKGGPNHHRKVMLSELQYVGVDGTINQGGCQVNQYPESDRLNRHMTLVSRAAVGSELGPTTRNRLVGA